MGNTALRNRPANVARTNGDSMDPVKELTQEQKLKLNKLHKESLFRGFKMGLVASGLIIANNVMVIAIRTLLEIESDSFIFFGSMIGAFLIFRKLGQNIRSEHDRVRAEAKKILES